MTLFFVMRGLGYSFLAIPTIAIGIQDCSHLFDDNHPETEHPHHRAVAEVYEACRYNLQNVPEKQHTLRHILSNDGYHVGRTGFFHPDGFYIPIPNC